MKNLYGILAIGGFMVTMLCYVLAGIQVEKSELLITFMIWLGIEGVMHGVAWIVSRFHTSHRPHYIR